MKILRSEYYFILLLLQVSVFPAYGITAGFTYTKLSNCPPAIVKFTNTSTRGTGITYSWDFGLGAIVSETDYSVKEQLFTETGQYKVTLKVTDGVNSDSTYLIISIAKGPVADFTADHYNGCPPMLVSFTSTSVPGESEIINTSWDFRNGVNKEGESVLTSYNNTGIYDVILKVTDRNGCYSILESDNSIIVAEKPGINFAASDTFACAPPLNVSFINLSTGSSRLDYNWDFGNGHTSADLSNSSVYNTAGSYTVKLRATDQSGCSDSLIKESYITIGYPKGILFIYDASNNDVAGKSFLCDGTYRFVYSSDKLPDYTWTITDNDKTATFTGSNSIIYKITGSGKIDIKLVYGKNSFCTDSILASFAKSYIKAAFTLDDTLFCSVPSQVSLISSSQNADKVAWYFSDRLISDQNVSSYTITRSDLPPETWQQLYNHEVDKIKLPFKLVASNGGVCSDSLVHEVSIALPVARFMPDKVSGCVPLQVSFSDSSRSLSGIDSYTYKIGSDSVRTLTGLPVNYTFTLPGEYQVSEIIRNGNCIDTSEIVLIVAGDKLLPDFSVTPGEVCNGDSIHLLGNTGNNLLPSMWRFRAANLFDLSFTAPPDTIIPVYSDSTGYWDISLRVDYNGCSSDTTKRNVLRIKGPAGNFSESFSCDSSLVYHFKSAIAPATSLSWNIDTTTINNSDSVRYVFPSSGNYTVKLTANDNSSNCTLTRTKLMTVRKVMADFTVNDSIFCTGEIVELNSGISRDFINICYNEGFLWDFGDDSPPRRTFTSTYDHIYSSRGTDTIVLVVTADNGCMDTARKVIKVFRPEGSFVTDKTTGCVPDMSINFANASTDPTIISWSWNFGDNTPDITNSMNISHLYSNNEQKTYYPTLTVYDAYQCSSGYSIPVELVAINGNFQADDNEICIGQTVTFTPVDSSLTDLHWDFGEGITPVNTHTYLSPGRFTVSLISAKEGCTRTVVKANYINVEKADASFTFGDSLYYCYPDTLHFVHNNSVGSPVVDYQWTFDSHILNDRTSNDVRYTFIRPGNYLAQLAVKTLNGCTASKFSHIAITGPNAAVSFTPHSICYNDVVSFKIDSLTDVNTWKWLFGDGSTSTEDPSSHRYTSRGKIVPSIQLINANCNAILVMDTLLVSKVKAGFNSSDNSLKICDGNKLDLVNSSVFSNSWRWDIDNIQKSADFNLSGILFTNTGDHLVRLIAREINGCTDTVTKIFSVVNNPVFSISGDSILCSGMNSVSLSVSKNPGEEIKWTPSSGLSDPSAFITTASPASSTTYKAEVTDANGCKASKEKTIVVNQPFDLTRLPLGDTSIFLGERVQLIVLTGTEDLKYSWSPDYNISCLNCNNPWVAPTETMTYTVETSNDCFNFSEEFKVEVINDFYLEAPAAFTPNGDSNNDSFKFEEKNITNFELKIFNRWGEIVFSTNDVQLGWDGNVNGHPQNTDTYKYSVEAVTIHGYKFGKKGEFLLLR
jgi:gliding motility-associated-like protein